jgi:hypothetical protein
MPTANPPEQFVRMSQPTRGIGNTFTKSNEPEAQRHAEGPVAAAIEEYTAQIPSDIFLWAAGGSILGSLALKASGKDHAALFVGQWVAPFLVLGLYNKLVKVAGTDRAGTNG